MSDFAGAKTQLVYGRLAGLLFLVVFATAVLGHFVLPAGIFVTGDFEATTLNMVANEQSYRFALAARIASALLTIFLAGALYALLAPVDRTLALFALLSRTGEAVLGGVNVIFLIVAMGIYTGATNTFSLDEQKDLVQLFLYVGDDAFFAIAIIFFSVGSAIFFYLLFKSRFIPRIFSLPGALGSVPVTLLGFALLAGFEPPININYFFAIAAVGEIFGGLWLMLVGVNFKYWRRDTEDGALYDGRE